MTRGRKAFNRESMLEKLEAQFIKGQTDEIACLRCGCSVSWLMRYQTANPNYSKRKMALKSTPVAIAKDNIIELLNMGDRDITKFVASTLGKDEFSTRSEVSGIDNTPISVEVSFANIPPNIPA